MVGCKNDAVSANTFPIPPAPLSAFEGDHIPLEWIDFEGINCPLDLRLDTTG
jgi:hypothetical protein